MRKYVSVATMVIGLLLIVGAIVIAAVVTDHINIVGGAGWFTFQQQFRKVSWMAMLGGVCCLAGAVLFILRKK